MRTLPILLLLVLVVVTASSQTVRLNGIVSVKLPKEKKKFDRGDKLVVLRNSSIAEIAKSEFSLLNVNNVKTIGKYYTVGNFVIRLIGTKQKKDPGYLQDMKNHHELYNSKQPLEDIQHFPDYSAFVTYYKLDTLGLHFFTAIDHATGTKYLKGTLECLDNDRVEARRLVGDIIKSIKFK